MYSLRFAHNTGFCKCKCMIADKILFCEVNYATGTTDHRMIIIFVVFLQIVTILINS
jgi:hypothetical protein